MQDADRQSDTTSSALSRKREIRLLAFVLVVLFPLLTVILVGGIGLTVWIWQTFTTPPFPG